MCPQHPLGSPLSCQLFGGAVSWLPWEHFFVDRWHCTFLRSWGSQRTGHRTPAFAVVPFLWSPFPSPLAGVFASRPDGGGRAVSAGFTLAVDRGAKVSEEALLSTTAAWCAGGTRRRTSAWLTNSSHQPGTPCPGNAVRGPVSPSPCMSSTYIGNAYSWGRSGVPAWIWEVQWPGGCCFPISAHKGRQQ